MGIKPEQMSRNIILCSSAAAMLTFSCLSASAHENGEYIQPCSHKNPAAQAFVEQKMTEEPFRSGLCGILAVTAGGDTLADYNSLHKLLPASNTKLITTGLAIRRLGPDYRFRTKIGYSGQIRDSILHGDLYIVGGGDPTIASGDRMALSSDSLFSVWKSMISKAGISRIEGHVIGDGRYFDGPIENDSWSYNDLGAGYGAGGNGLCFYRNIQEINAAPGMAPDDAAEVSVSYPETPWIDFRNISVTAPAGSGDNLYLFNTDLAPVAEMRGSLAIDKGQRKEECSNKFGALTCAWYFTKYLTDKGMAVTEGAADIDSYGNVREASTSGQDATGKVRLKACGPAIHADSLTIIGTFLSPSVKEIAAVTNLRSDNFYAEALIRMLSKECTGFASYDSCRAVIPGEIKSLGVDCGQGLVMVDGSGLARHNYISPDFFCRFLKAMSTNADYVRTIAHPGESRVRNLSRDDRLRIRMKSGSMNGVLCFSGYISSASGRPENDIIFSIMTNNCPDGQKEVKIFIDRLLSLLVSYRQ